MMTLQEDWRLYRDSCYPLGLSAEQSQALHMAFIAGALVGLEAMDAAGKTTTAAAEQEAAEHLDSLLAEAREWARQIFTEAKRRTDERKAQEN